VEEEVVVLCADIFLLFLLVQRELACLIREWMDENSDRYVRITSGSISSFAGIHVLSTTTTSSEVNKKNIIIIDKSKS
jgi:hypothetical protein